MTGFKITPDQHRQIANSISTFRRQISAGPSDKAAIGVELAKLIAAFPTQDQGDTPASMRIEAYSDAIGAAPAWAVREARLKIVRGETDLDRRFAPTPPQLADLVKAILRPFRSDLADLEALGTIEPELNPSEAERERVGKAFDDFRAELKQGIDKAEAERKARVLEYSEKANATLFERECRAAGRDPNSQVSPSLLKILSKPVDTPVTGDVSQPVKIDAEAMADIPDALERQTIGTFEKLKGGLAP